MLNRILAALNVAAFLTLLSQLLGCGGDDSGTQPVTMEPIICQDLDGLYSIKHTRRSGDCNEPEEIITEVKPGTDVGEGCTGKITLAADTCSQEMDITCSDTETTIRTTGKLSWNQPGTEVSGTIYVQYSGPDGDCASTYTLTMRKL